MSIIQKIRDKGTWFLFSFVILALIAFIVQDGLNSGGGWFKRHSTTVGVVEGKKIDYMVYQERVKQMEDQYAGRYGKANNDQIQNDVWKQFVLQEVMEKQKEELGLQVTSKEVNDMLFINPNSGLRQQFTDKKTGQFDPNPLKQQIAEIRKKKDKEGMTQLNEFINSLVSERIKEKYSSLLEKTEYTPKWMKEKTNADKSLIASVSYAFVPYSAVADSSVKVTDEDINAYVGKHKDNFKQTESRSISYVSFDAGPSAKDSADLWQQLAQLKGELAATTEASSFLVRNGSETDFLDGYVLKSKMQMPDKDSIQNLAEGAVYGPYLDVNQYVLAKMIGKRTIPDSVKVRHILIATVNPQTGQPVMADSVAKKRADSIAVAVKGGADFRMLVVQYSGDDGSKEKGGEYEFTSQQFSSLAKEFAEEAFYAPAGDKKVIKTEFGYHYIEVLSQKAFGPACKVAYMSKSIVPSNETDNMASGAANQFAGESRNAKAFGQNVVKRKYNRLIATDIKPTASSIPAIGENRQLVRWIYEAEKGDVSEPYTVGDKYIVAMVAEINEEGTMSASKARPTVEGILRNQKKAAILLKKIGTPSSLEAVARAAGSSVPVERADSLKFSEEIIPNVGQEPKIVGAAFNKQWQGKLTPAIAGNGGVFVIKTESIGAVPTMEGSDSMDMQKYYEMMMRGQSGQQSESMEALIKAADVKDKRAEFL